MGEQRELAGVLRKLDRLGGLGPRRRPAAEPEVQVQADGQPVDQRAHRAGVARRGGRPVGSLGAVELLGPQRRVGGHADHLDDGQRIALQQVGLAHAQQQLALLDVAEREVGLGDHGGGRSSTAGSAKWPAPARARRSPPARACRR